MFRRNELIADLSTAPDSPRPKQPPNRTHRIPTETNFFSGRRGRRPLQDIVEANYHKPTLRVNKLPQCSAGTSKHPTRNRTRLPKTKTTSKSHSPNPYRNKLFFGTSSRRPLQIIAEANSTKPNLRVNKLPQCAKHELIADLSTAPNLPSPKTTPKPHSPNPYRFPV